MKKYTECGKICLIADKGKMLYNASVDAYTPKAYLFAESEQTAWTEVDDSEIPATEPELTETEQKALAYDILMGVSE